MIYRMANGATVRARTCNDHILIAVADSPAEDANLNIEGTDWLLVIMPEIERTPGRVLAYLVPTDEAVKHARQTHAAWLASKPNTRGSNTTFNLWFRKHSAHKANDYATKWRAYRLDGDVTTDADPTSGATSGQEVGGVKAEVVAAQHRIAAVAGVAPEAVKISIDFGAT